MIWISLLQTKSVFGLCFLLNSWTHNFWIEQKYFALNTQPLGDRLIFLFNKIQWKIQTFMFWTMKMSLLEKLSIYHVLFLKLSMFKFNDKLITHKSLFFPRSWYYTWSQRCYRINHATLRHRSLSYIDFTTSQKPRMYCTLPFVSYMLFHFKYQDTSNSDRATIQSIDTFKCKHIRNNTLQLHSLYHLHHV